MLSWALWVMLGARGPAGRGPSAAAEARADVASRPTTTDVVVCEAPWEELVRAWSASSAALMQAHTDGARHALVTLRAAILDELERRDPRSYRRWVAAEQQRLGLSR